MAMHNNTNTSVSSPTRTVCLDMEHFTGVRTISRSASPIACDVCIPAMFNLCDNKLIKACLLLRFIRNVFFFPRNFVDSINLTSIPTSLVFLLPCALSLVLGPPSYPSSTTDALMNLDSTHLMYDSHNSPKV